MSPIDFPGLRCLLESVPDGYFVHDETGRYLDANAQSCRDLGYTLDELLQLTINDISAGAAPADNLERWRNAPPGLAMSLNEIARRKDGSTFPVEIRLTCQLIEGRKLFFGLARDVSDREAARRAMEEMNDRLEARVTERGRELGLVHERLELAARVGGLGIWDLDMATLEMHCDEQWYRIMGRDPAQPVRSIEEFRALIHPDDADRATEIEQTAARLIAANEDYGIVFRIVRPEGEVRWVRSAARVFADEAGIATRSVGFVVDVTDMRRAEAALQQQALEDPLTGLANRRRLDEALVKACLHAARTGDPVCVAMIDVDYFKLYNDFYGHGLGDEALRVVADILKSAARRPYDLAARYGGEEFVLLLPGVTRPEAILAGIIEALAERAIPHLGSSAAPHLTVSCGCVVAGDDPAALAPGRLLAECDQALYRAKSLGRKRAHIVRI